MPHRSLIGARIRSRRLDLGISQQALARSAGISASYLNLIEHNRRRIGGKLLADLARALSVDPATLSEAADQATISTLTQAAKGRVVEPPEDLAARYPGWAGVVAAQTNALLESERRIAALQERVAHDPALSAALHQVISTVTSIRSTSSILVEDAQLDPDWQRRFSRNVYDDSRRLAEVSQALVRYLETPSERGIGEAFSNYLEARGWHLPELEVESGSLKDVPPHLQEEAERWAAQYRDAAVAMPLPQLRGLIADSGIDPAGVAATFGVSLRDAMHRLARMPSDMGVSVGLAECDAAGALIALKPCDGFALPRATPACPLWPLYQALSQPGVPLHSTVVLPGAEAVRLSCYAIAERAPAVAFDAPAMVRSTMLVVSDAPTVRPQPVGQTCAICPRDSCSARRMGAAATL